MSVSITQLSPPPDAAAQHAVFGRLADSQELSPAPTPWRRLPAPSRPIHRLRLIPAASARKRTALRIRRQRIERAYLAASALTALLLLLSSF